MLTVFAIAAGGATGAVLRHGMNMAALAAFPTSFPLGILLINITGSFLMGVLTGVFAHLWEPSQTVKLFLTVGVLGGFTTFSAFSLDTVLLWQRGEVAQAVLYVLSSVVFSIGALVLGLWIARVLS